MISITPKQAIDVWVHLEQAYQGKHGYGGSTAEIYCYLVQQRAPGIDGPVPSQGGFGYEAFVARAQETAQTFDWIFERFVQEHPEASIEIDGRSLAEWRRVQVPQGELHRLHVTITREEER